MRHGRLKAARKTLDFFRLATGITPPYEVLVDGTFLVAVVAQKLPLQERLDRTLQHKQFFINVTRSTLDELKTLSEHSTSKKEIFQQARQWGLDNSDNIIEESDIPDQDNNSDQYSNLGRAGGQTLSLIRAHPTYFVCSQDEKILDMVRSMGTSPVMRISRGVLLLENPSKASARRVSSQEKTKWSVSGSIQEQETKLIDYVRENQKRKYQMMTTDNQRIPSRSRQKARGPNPLSCKKKKVTEVPNEKRKRKRRRKN